jgi:general secretion pathway protein C
MWKGLLVVKNLLFLAGLAFLSAKILQSLILPHVLRYEPPTSGQVIAKIDAQERVVPPLRAYTAISQSNIFNSESGKDDAQNDLKEEEPQEPMDASELNVVLLGTTVGPPEDTFAVIQDLQSREQDLYQVGDTVQEEAQIVKVSRCQVVLKRDGGKEFLECIEPDERVPRRPQRAVRSNTPRAGKGIRRISRNRYLIDEERVESALANVNRLMTQIRVVPNLRGRKNEGWKVFAIRPNSIFSEVGLKNGDVIQSVNGKDLSSMEKAYQAFQDLRDTSHLEVELVRRGRQQTLHYQIR